jgi:hypothetical protein
MILTGRTPRLRVDNYLQALTAKALTVKTDDGGSMEEAAAQFL